MANAEAIAEKVHEKQLDKSGEAYIGHPRRVYFRVKYFPPFELTPEEQATAEEAAWLHDVLEDSGTNGFIPVLREELLSWGFSQETVDAVVLLSRGHWQDKETFVERDPETYYSLISEHRVARAVKLCDIADNCNEQRMNKVEEPKRSQLIEKYLEAREELEITPHEQAWFDEDTRRTY